jgi:hypothetical protein
MGSPRVLLYESGEFRVPILKSNFDGVSYSIIFPAQNKNTCVILLKLDLVIFALFAHSVAYLP